MVPAAYDVQVGAAGDVQLRDEIDARVGVGAEGELSATFEAADVEPGGDGPEWRAIVVELADLDARELFAWVRGLRGAAHGALDVVEERGLGVRYGGQLSFPAQLKGLEFEVWLSTRLEAALAEQSNVGFVAGRQLMQLPLWGAWELLRWLAAARGFVAERGAVHDWGSWPGGVPPLGGERGRIAEHDLAWIARVEQAVRIELESVR